MQHRLRRHKEDKWGPWTNGPVPADYLGWFETRQAAAPERVKLMEIDEVDRAMIERGDRIGASLQRALLKFHDDHALLPAGDAKAGAVEGVRP